MGGLRNGLRGGLAILVIVMAAACGGTSTTDAADTDAGTTQHLTETSVTPGSEEPESPAPVASDSLETPEGVAYGECGTLATMIEFNAPIEAELNDTKLYLCVEVPEGVTTLVFDLTDMTAALNLFVGYPDLGTLEAGGEHFWASESGGRDDESITIEPGASGFVEAGPYFIEISGGSSADGASFVLTVNMS